MWLSERFRNSNSNDVAECGSVLVSGESMEADSSQTTRSLKLYSPYGYSFQPPVGEEVMLLPLPDSQAIIGTRLNLPSLEAGEVQIMSKGGASIVLKNDGSVVINSLVINKEGEIVK